MTEKRMEGQASLFDLDIWSGKTFPEPSAATEAKTSRRSSRKSSGSQTRKLPMCLCLIGGGTASLDVSTIRWEDGALLGEFMTLSFGEYPSEENVSRLSQILEDSAHPKYSLSARACNGILNRALKRGKELPKELKTALEKQARDFGSQESTLSEPKEKTDQADLPTSLSKTTPSTDRQCLMASGFDGQMGAKAQGIGYAEEQVPTLKSGGGGMDVLIR